MNKCLLWFISSPGPGCCTALKKKAYAIWSRPLTWQTRLKWLQIFTALLGMPTAQGPILVLWSQIGPWQPGSSCSPRSAVAQEQWQPQAHVAATLAFSFPPVRCEASAVSFSLFPFAYYGPSLFSSSSSFFAFPWISPCTIYVKS